MAEQYERLPTPAPTAAFDAAWDIIRDLTNQAAAEGPDFDDQAAVTATRKLLALPVTHTPTREQVEHALAGAISSRHGNVYRAAVDAVMRLIEGGES